jgi:hypothetical protein
MGMLKLWTVLAFGAVSIATAACGSSSSNGGDTSGNGTPSSGASSLSDYCGTVCAKANTCDHTQDVQTCENTCTNNNAAGFPKMRADVVSKIESCANSSDCQAVIAGTALTECKGEALASFAPTGAETSFCDSYWSAASKCSVTIDKGACLEDHKIYNDAALNAASGCLSKACTDVPACLNAAFGIPAPTTGTSSLGVFHSFE